MYKSCSWCGKIHDYNYDCPAKPKKLKKDTYANKFRHSIEWTNKRAEIVKRDNYLCQVCLKNNILTYDYVEVHHNIPIMSNYDLRLEDSNLIALCVMCHGMAERGEISRDIIEEIINKQNSQSK